MRKSTVGYWVVIIFILAWGLFFYQDDQANMNIIENKNEDYNSTLNDYAKCKDTLSSVSNDTIGLMDKEYISKEELGNYFMKISKTLQDTGAIKKVAE